MFGISSIFRYWSRLSLSYRGAAIVTIPALCLLATLGGWFWSRSEGLEWRTQIEASQHRLSTTSDLMDAMVNAETGMRGYLLSGDPLFLEPYKKSQTQLPATLAKLARSSEKDRSKLMKITSIEAQVLTINKLITQLKSATSMRENLLLLKQNKQEMDVLRLKIADFEQVERGALDRKYIALNNFQSVVQSLQQLLTVAGIVSTVGGIYLFWLLERELNERNELIQTGKSTIETLNNDIIDGIAIVNSAGQIENVNPAWIEMFGYPFVDLLECPFMRMLVAPIIDGSQHLPNLQEWLETRPKLGRIWQTEAYRQDGTKFPIELSLSEIPLKKQWIAIVRDVSAQANLMQQLQGHLHALEQLNLALVSANSLLERRNQELAEFAYVTAHDLKTPVRGIATLSEWIEEEVKTYSSPELQHYIQLLRQRTYRLNGLIDGLWEYTTLDKSNVNPEPFQLNDLLRQIQVAFPLPPDFEIELHSSEIGMTTWKSHLCKVIKELLKNAVKHHDRQQGKIDIFVELSAGQVHFIVRDDGPGISPAYHQRVFRLFETVEPRDLHDNRGIGLRIVKKLVERVKGRIWLESPALSRGLAVHFTWPQHSVAGDRD